MAATAAEEGLACAMFGVDLFFRRVEDVSVVSSAPADSAGSGFGEPEEDAVLAVLMLREARKLLPSCGVLPDETEPFMKRETRSLPGVSLSVEA
jgi:hypothetical protein